MVQNHMEDAVVRIQLLCSYAKVKPTLTRRGAEIGSVVASYPNFEIAKVDFKLHSLLKALMQASLVIWLSTGCAKTYPTQTSKTTREHFGIQICAKIIVACFREYSSK